MQVKISYPRIVRFTWRPLNVIIIPYRLSKPQNGKLFRPRRGREPFGVPALYRGIPGDDVPLSRFILKRGNSEYTPGDCSQSQTPVKTPVRVKPLARLRPPRDQFTTPATASGRPHVHVREIVIYILNFPPGVYTNPHLIGKYIATLQVYTRGVKLPEKFPYWSTFTVNRRLLH